MKNNNFPNQIRVLCNLGVGGQRGRVNDEQGVMPCLLATDWKNPPKILTRDKEENSMKKYRIRKLTPTECMRLMGVTDEDIQKIKDIRISNSQMYKQAGNSLVSNCVELIFEHLYKAQYDNNYITTDESYTSNTPTANECIQAGILSDDKYKSMQDISRRFYSTQGVAPTMHTCGGGNTEPKIWEDN